MNKRKTTILKTNFIKKIMKKKVISAVLLAVMTLATTSTFVSCKDYSDDISDLQGQLVEETLKSTTLEAQLKSTKEALEEQLTELQATYETQLAEAKTALQNSINEKADATVVSQLATRVVDLETGLAAAQSSLQAQITTCNNAIESINTALASKATVAELNAVKAQAASDLAALSGNVDQLVEQLNTLASETNTKIATILANLATLQAKDTELANKDNEILSTVSQNYQTLLNKIAEEKQAVEAKVSQEEAARIAAINDLTTQVQALQAFQAAIQASDFQTQISDLTTALNDYKAEIAAADFQGQINAIKANITTVQGDITTLSGKISANEISISQLQTEMATVNNALTNINAEIASLKVLIDKVLNSLVFKPTQYIYGFGVINVQSFTDCVKLKREYNSALQVEEWKPNTDATQISKWSPKAKALYHVNPTTANVDNYTFSFIDAQAKNEITRSDLKTKSIIAEDITATNVNGILTVEFKIQNPEDLNDAVTQVDPATPTSTYANVTTLALQAKGSTLNGNHTRTITSDYALVVPNYYGNLRLANKKATNTNATNHTNGDDYVSGTAATAGGNRCDHLRTKAVDTYNDPDTTCWIVFNKELDLKEYIETHYGTSSTEKGAKVGDKAFTEAEFAAAGLKYKYDVVSFNGKPSIAEVDANGVTKLKEQDGKYIGQTYIVRIFVLDGEGEKLAVGYVKILVKDANVVDASISSRILLDCSDVDSNPNSNKVVIALSDIVDQFMTYSSALTINDFKGSKYSLESDVYSNNTTPTLFGKGTFSLSGNDLVLSFTPTEAQQLFYTNNVVVLPQDKIEVYAKFSQKQQGFSDLWVKITVKKEDIIYAQGTFADADKIKAFWYKKDSRIPATEGEYNEVHVNVAVPENNDFTASGAPNFANDILFKTFVGGKAHISGINSELTHFNANSNATLTIADNAFNNRVVMGASGNYYQLSVMNYDLATPKNDEQTLSAYKVGESTANAQKIVVLSGTNNGVVTYQENDYAKDILNYAPHDVFGTSISVPEDNKTFAVEILMRSDNNLCYAIELANNDFQIQFLRPINVTDKEAPATQDAEHGAGIWYIENLVSFRDWREYPFDTYNLLYSYYGLQDQVNSTTGDLENAIRPRNTIDKIDPTTGLKIGEIITDATTNINSADGGTYELLSQVAPGIELTWYNNVPGTRFSGMIKYVNNGATVNQTFKIKVPIAITYAWGTIYTEATLTITPTIHNLKK